MTIHKLKHPLGLEKLSILRSKNTSSDIFAKNLEELSLLLFIEATKNLDLKKVKIDTPFKQIDGDFIKKEILLVPILRAGMGMVSLIRKFFSNTHVGMIGLKRDEHILKPITYYVNLPKNLSNFDIFILDPMLATGGSIVKTMEILSGYNAKPDAIISIISAPEGLKLVEEYNKDVDIYTVAVDEKLNENGYIIPGLGDAGDRFFNTEE